MSRREHYYKNWHAGVNRSASEMEKDTQCCKLLKQLFQFLNLLSTTVKMHDTGF